MANAARNCNTLRRLDRQLGLRHSITLSAIHGDIDKAVPLEANSREVRKSYETLVGEMLFIAPAGRDHNVWSRFFQCQELVDFVIAVIANAKSK